MTACIPILEKLFSAGYASHSCLKMRRDRMLGASIFDKGMIAIDIDPTLITRQKHFTKMYKLYRSGKRVHLTMTHQWKVIDSNELSP